MKCCYVIRRIGWVYDDYNYECDGDGEIEEILYSEAEAKKRFSLAPLDPGMYYISLQTAREWRTIGFVVAN